MRVEFPEIYEKFFTEGSAQFQEIKQKKKKAFMECIDEQIKKSDGYFSGMLMRA